MKAWRSWKDLAEVVKNSRGVHWHFTGRVAQVDAKYINAIKKGIMQKWWKGPLRDPVVKYSVSVYDGKMHSVDSNDMAFMLASTNSFKSAFRNAAPQILEPIYELTVLCADTVMGDVMETCKPDEPWSWAWTVTVTTRKSLPKCHSLNCTSIHQP